MPKVGKLFALPHAAVRVIYVAVGLHKIFRNVPYYQVISNGIEDFKANNGFCNDHLETSAVRIVKKGRIAVNWVSVMKDHVACGTNAKRG